MNKLSVKIQLFIKKTFLFLIRILKCFITPFRKIFSKFNFKKIITFLSISLSLSLIGFVGVFYFIFYFSKDLPRHDNLKDFFPIIKMRMISSNGEIIAEYYKENRAFIPIKFIPQKVINAFLAAEDKNFYNHHGLDFKALIRAIILNITNIGKNKRLVGASTITQQVAKNFFLGSQQSMFRKIKEAILAYRLEKILTKERILEIYLNQFYFGQGCYGIVTAAKKYFNKSIEDLSIAECSYLASLVKGANNYHPIRNRQKALTRRNWVIDRQFEEKMITKEERDLAKKDPFITYLDLSKKKLYEANSFVEEVRREIIKMYGSNGLYENGFFVRTTLDTRIQDIAKKKLQEGILKIDKKLGFRGPIQNPRKDFSIECEEFNLEIAKIKTISNNEIEIHVLSNEELEKLKKEPETLENNQSIQETEQIIDDEKINGKILKKSFSWAENHKTKINEKLKENDYIFVKKINKKNSLKNSDVTSYSLEQIPELQGAIIVMNPNNGNILAMQGGFDFKKSEFNRATQAKRQIGSLIKPFIYLTALSKGLTPATKINTGFISIETPTGEVWTPRNASKDKFPDAIPLRIGLEKSINTVTLNVARYAGVENILNTIQLFDLFDEEPNNISFLLGACETTLLRVATAYSMIANGGKKISPNFIESIQNKEGKVIHKSTYSACNGCLTLDKDSKIAPQIIDIRKNIFDEARLYQLVSMLEGVVKKYSESTRITMAGKTGTSNESMNVWFVGFSPDILVAVFAGYDNPKKIAKWAYGSTIALPIFVEFMKEYSKGQKMRPFKVPENINFKFINKFTGEISNLNDKDAILESFKEADDMNFYPEADDENLKIIDTELEYLKRLFKKSCN